MAKKGIHMTGDKEISFTYGPFRVLATMVVGDWQGDPAVPNGVQFLPPYADRVQVFSIFDTEESEDVYDYLDEQVLEKINDAMFDELPELGAVG